MVLAQPWGHRKGAKPPPARICKREGGAFVVTWWRGTLDAEVIVVSVGAKKKPPKKKLGRAGMRSGSLAEQPCTTKCQKKKGMRTEEKRTSKGGKVHAESIRCTTKPFHGAGVAVAAVSVSAWGCLW